MKISTRIGDKGKSRLYSGRMLGKSSLVFEVLGNFDELNTALGLCKSEIAKIPDQVGNDSRSGNDREGGINKEEFFKILEILQTDIYRIMAIIGSDLKVPKEIHEIDRKDVLLLEQFIEKFESEGGEVGKFVMPGENEASARLHFARAVCRRAERSLVAYDKAEAGSFGGVPEFILQYVNRMSDLLFLMACF
ncbi:MAG: cob(I)yrinic acid a,c-diamide adenosyltransferase [Candidatus Gracilibacteria bacterium]|jgi:cob(I)alamin adenosyltransferase